MLDISLFDGFEMLDVLRCRLVLESKEGCQYFEKVNIPIEGIGMYGAEQQILEERRRSKLNWNVRMNH